MATKSLHEIKMNELKKKKGNVITDSDYYLRDKSNVNDFQKNTIDMTPAPAKATKATKED